MTESITQAQAAEIVGVTSRRLRQLESEDAAPPRGSDGTYPATDFGKWIRVRLMSELGVANDGKAYDYEAERARLTKAQADKTELEVAELRAELVRVPLVETHWQAMIAAMRARLVGLPSKIAPQVAGPDDLTRVQDMIQSGVYEALAEIAGDAFPDDVRRRIILAADGRNDSGEAAAEADSNAVGKRAPAAKRGRQRGAGSVSE